MKCRFEEYCRFSYAVYFVCSSYETKTYKNMRFTNSSKIEAIDISQPVTKVDEFDHCIFI